MEYSQNTYIPVRVSPLSIALLLSNRGPNRQQTTDNRPQTIPNRGPNSGPNICSVSLCLCVSLLPSSGLPAAGTTVCAWRPNSSEDEPLAIRFGTRGSAGAGPSGV